MQMIQGDLLIPEPRLQQWCCNALLSRLPRLAAFQSLPSAKKSSKKDDFHLTEALTKSKALALLEEFGAGSRDVFLRQNL